MPFLHDGLRLSELYQNEPFLPVASSQIFSHRAVAYGEELLQPDAGPHSSILIQVTLWCPSSL